MSIVTVPPAPQSPANTAVSAGDWWPEIDCNTARDVLRLGDAITHDRLVAALQGAAMTVLTEVRDWKAARVAEGFTALAQVAPDDLIDGVTMLQLAFLRAVRFHAAAELVDTYLDATATNDAINRADAKHLTADDYRRMATHAIRDLIGTTRTAVELI